MSNNLKIDILTWQHEKGCRMSQGKRNNIKSILAILTDKTDRQSMCDCIGIDSTTQRSEGYVLLLVCASASCKYASFASSSCLAFLKATAGTKQRKQISKQCFV